MTQLFELVPGKLYKLKKRTYFGIKPPSINKAGFLEQAEIVIYIKSEKDGKSIMHSFLGSNKLLCLWDHPHCNEQQTNEFRLETFELI